MSIIRLSLVLAILCIYTSIANATNGDTLKSDLRIRLGQVTASNSNWSDAQLYRCLNMAQIWISAQGRAVEKQETLAGGSIRLAAPSDYIRLRGGAYLWRNGKEVRPIPLVSLDSIYRLSGRLTKQAMGNDNFLIYEDAGKLMVVPEVSSADSVMFSYYAQPAKLDSATECGFPAEWEQVLLIAAKAIALEKIRDISWWEATVQERDKLLAAMYQQVALKPQLVTVP